MSIVTLSGREQEPQVHTLISQAQIHVHKSEADVRAPVIAAEYANSADLCLWGWIDGRDVVGLVGVEDRGGGAGVVRDIAVAPNRQGRGIGRGLIRHTWKHFETLTGDTLETATDFYRACGFSITPGGTLPDGREIFQFSASTSSGKHS